MAIRKVQYTLSEGQNTITDAANIGLRVVLKVKREGMCYFKVTDRSTADDLEVRHFPLTGKLKFHTVANEGGEKVYVLIKE